MAEAINAWLSIPAVQLCAVLFAALTVVLIVRGIKRSISGKPKNS